MPRKGENIYKRKDGRWEGRYKSGFDDSGKSKYRSVYGKTYQSVKEKLTALKAVPVPDNSSGKLTVKELFEEWLSAVRLKVKKSTYANYRMKADKHILPEFSGLLYEQLTVQMLHNFIESKLNSGLSAKYVSDIVIVFKSMTKYISQVYGFKNPLTDVILPKTIKTEMQLLNENQQNKLCDHLLKNPDNTAICILISLYTGLRIGEICGLKWSDMKSDIQNIQKIQQETLLEMGRFVTEFNEKIESVDNFHMLTTEIEQGKYNNSYSHYSLCCVLAQLDKRVLENERKLGIIKTALEKSGIINNSEILLVKYLQNIISLPDDKIGTVYMELCNFRDSFPANVFVEMIETYHFLPKIEKKSTNKTTLVNKLLEKYGLDSSSAFSSIDVYKSFLENKQDSLVDIKQIQEVKSFDAVSKSVNTPKISVLNSAESGVPQSYNNAVYWYEKAREQGDPIAQYKLGYCYYHGIGVETNKKEAYHFIKLAANHWYSKASEFLRKHRELYAMYG